MGRSPAADAPHGGADSGDRYGFFGAGVAAGGVCAAFAWAMMP
jgi:hypothetical protein